MKNQSSSAPDFLLEEFLPFRLSVLSNTVSQGISSAYRKQFGLSVTEWRVVAVLGRFPGLTASDITERTAMDKVAVSRAVNRLLAKKLLERGSHSQDRRRLPLKLAPVEGVALFNEVVPKALDYERRFLSALSAEELDSFKDMLGKLRAAAEALNRDQA